MIEIEKPQIECVETPGDASYGKYVIEPLERGYGTTLGNALRRILLSSLPGTAATSIKIAGVQHEFSTIPGVKEDVTEIVLNVKNLLTKLHCEGTKTVFIEAAGPCEVTAGDIKPDGEVEVLLYYHWVREELPEMPELYHSDGISPPLTLDPPDGGDLWRLNFRISTQDTSWLMVEFTDSDGTEYDVILE